MQSIRLHIKTRRLWLWKYNWSLVCLSTRNDRVQRWVTYFHRNTVKWQSCWLTKGTFLTQWIDLVTMEILVMNTTALIGFKVHSCVLYKFSFLLMAQNTNPEISSTFLARQTVECLGSICLAIVTWAKPSKIWRFIWLH